MSVVFGFVLLIKAKHLLEITGTDYFTISVHQLLAVKMLILPK